jgi:outer membrane protein assembly factor BamD (BamD/ComL family)
MSRHPQKLASLALALLWLLMSGCALFKSPDANDLPGSNADPDDVATGTDPNKQKPLIDPEAFKSANIRRNWKKMWGKGPDRNVARKLYEDGTAAYNEASKLEGEARQQKFAEAAKHFVNAADRWPDSSLEQDALFMAGECYYFGDYYVDANRQYEQLVKKYANSRHLDVVEARRFVIARYWVTENDERPYLTGFNLTDPERPWFDTRGNALRVYDKIRVDDPTGKLADDATLAAANERFAKKEWAKADELYADLATAYPESEHQFDAHFLGLKAKLNTYRGSDYEGSSLDEAEKLIKQMRRMFPKEAADEREFLDRSFAEIRYKKAERIWKNGEYYDFRTEYGAAKFYYAIVLREYDDTPFAQRATKRMEELKAEPDTPPQRLKWLVKLFPESDELKPILDKAMIKPGEQEVEQASVNVNLK